MSTGVIGCNIAVLPMKMKTIALKRSTQGVSAADVTRPSGSQVVDIVGEGRSDVHSKRWEMGRVEDLREGGVPLRQFCPV